MLNNKKLITATNVIILLNIIMYVIQHNMKYGTIIFGLNMYFLQANFWFQPLSSMFVHGSYMHIFMNMFILFQFGSMLEYFKGARFFLIFYLLGGIICSLLSFVFIYYFSPESNLIGASGAICLLLGYIAYVDKMQRKGLLIWILLISFAPLVLGEHIAWFAHIIGFCLGFLYALFSFRLFRKK